MIFFFNVKGELLKSNPDTVYQGSSETSTVYVVAPFNSGMVAEINYILPNGEVYGNYLLTNGGTAIDGKELSDGYAIWFTTLKAETTQYAGDLTAQVLFYATDNTKEQTADGVEKKTPLIATQAFKITIAKGVPRALPSAPTDSVYEQILSMLSMLSQDLASVQNEVPPVNIDDTTIMSVGEATDSGIIIGSNEWWRNKDGKVNIIPKSQKLPIIAGAGINLKTEDKKIIVENAGAYPKSIKTKTVDRVIGAPIGYNITETEEWAFDNGTTEEIQSQRNLPVEFGIGLDTYVYSDKLIISAYELSAEVYKKIDKTEAEASFVKKANRGSPFLYAGGKDGDTIAYLSKNPAANSVPQYSSNGNLKTNDPVADNDAANKKFVADQIANAHASVYNYKGSKDTYANLPATGNNVGDVWNVEDTGINYAWNGADWDSLSANVLDSTGDSAVQAMSQKATTDSLNLLTAKLNENIIKDPSKTYLVWRGSEFPNSSSAQFKVQGNSVIDWGDGIIETFNNPSETVNTHTYTDGIEYHLITYYNPFMDILESEWFKDCANLIRVNVGTKRLNSGTFSGCTNLENITLNKGMSSINTWCFYHCESLKEIVIPAYVIALLDGLFNGCINLTHIVMESTTPPTLSAQIPTNVEKIIVPKSAINAYKSASGWSLYADRIVYEVDSSDIPDMDNYVDLNSTQTIMNKRFADAVFLSPPKAYSGYKAGDPDNSIITSYNNGTIEFTNKDGAPKGSIRIPVVDGYSNTFALLDDIPSNITKYHHNVRLTTATGTIYYEYDSGSNGKATIDTIKVMNDAEITTLPVLINGLYSVVSGVVYKGTDGTLKVVAHGVYATSATEFGYLNITGETATIADDIVTQI